MPYRKDRIKKLVGFTANEWEKVKQNAQASGKRAGTYIRYISVHGEIKNYDMKIVQDVRMEMRKIGININQVAHMVNATQQVSRKDIERLSREVSKLNDVVEKWLKPLD